MLMLMLAVPGAKVFSSSKVMLENSASTHLTHTPLLLSIKHACSQTHIVAFEMLIDYDYCGKSITREKNATF